MVTPLLDDAGSVGSAEQKTGRPDPAGGDKLALASGVTETSRLARRATFPKARFPLDLCGLCSRISFPLSLSLLFISDE